MLTITNILLLLLAYLIGAIPFSIIAGKVLKGIDVREYGSGNAGATNTFRVLGKKAGIPVLLLDVFKGFLAVDLVWFTSYVPSTEIYINLQLAFGIAAVLGHVFPIYAGFRGGKGVATLLGFMIGVFPEAAAISIIVFVITLVFSKYVSLSSIFAGLFFPFGVYYLSEYVVPTMMIFAIFVPVLLIATHQRNIERLVRGDENKVKLRKKK
ncbi:MAG: glycerol-3-phosphate 1-O-acyltransferase PlsY [Flavobacteriales bacterium]|nr:glycerol-3-phosphate 1-O-acyltransferase PlsY [Flavobacteriales bacterium]MBL6872745.1 glycerol-3-phosphate 1-O-acyltransferase PlsY [Flavobacteriales bacterium]